MGDLFVESRAHRDEDKELRKILTVKNPKARFGGKFSSKQKEEITFISEDGRFLRGLLPHVLERLQISGIPVEVETRLSEPTDRPFVHCPPDLLSGAELRDYQVMAVEQSYNLRRGIVHVATGGGKTLIAAAVSKMVEQHDDGTTLTLVNKTHLLKQTYQRFQQYGLKDVGIIGAGYFNPSRHTVAMVQSLHSELKRGNDTYAGGVTLFNFDETHHLGADSWAGLAYNIPSRWAIGYSGTPFRDGFANMTDPADIQLQAICGNVIVRISASHLIQRGLLAKPYIFMVPIDAAYSRQSMDELPGGKETWHSVEKAWITDNRYRNNIITRLTRQLVLRGLNPLVLVSKIEHGKELLRQFVEAGLRPIFLSGGPKRHTYDPSQPDSVLTEVSLDADADVNSFLTNDPDSPNVLIGSTVFDEGVDLPAVNAVVNAAGGKSFVKNLQRVGRGLRPKKGTNEAYIFDFIDLGHYWTKSHSKERVSDYMTEPEYAVFEGYPATVQFFGEEW